MQRVILLTGPTHSGKTGALSATVRQPGVAGLLAPDLHYGRILEDLKSGEFERFQIHDDSEPSVEIGPYHFRAAAFDWANGKLKTAVRSRAKIIVVDEVGPLEMRGEGLRSGLDAVLARDHGTAVLVVREKLVAQVEALVGGEAEVATVETWPQVWQTVIDAA
ncbi:MAG TPA: nucleoside-triphosphatase [Sphingomonas sp.]|jgi:nucleoside-triphosphatase THEP1|nr:nucleoside-triphosphatase [Sphingomonas sp.]